VTNIHTGPSKHEGTGYQVSARTRQSLIEAAGELFAENGFNGTTTRAIADRAGVTLGGIHYHFGSKEELYLAAFRHICYGGEEDAIAALADGFRHDPDRPEATAAHLWRLVQMESRRVMAVDRPAWHARLLMRGIDESSPATSLLVDTVFRPGHLRWTRLYRQVRPQAGPLEADIWALHHAAIYVLYNQARQTVCLTLNRAELDAAFIDQATRHAARMLILSLDLPLPPELVNR
jgi:AcrR family transcriptional regulator